jgi:hypothetical protein
MAPVSAPGACGLKPGAWPGAWGPGPGVLCGMPHFRWLAYAASALLIGLPVNSEGRQPASPDPLCQVSTDSDYGTRIEHPIAVGGGSMSGPARQRRYLDALRGPDGQVVRYTRGGVKFTPDKEETVIDLYQVTYDGLDQPMTLYLDMYHFTELKAPAGLVCGATIDLGLPPADPITGRTQMNAYADRLSPEGKSPPAPIPLRGDSAMGVVLDHFRVLTRRLAPVKAGIPIGSVVIAYPQPCNGESVAPTVVRLVGGQGQAVAPDDTSSDPERMRGLALTASTPPGSVAAWFRADPLQARLQVYVEYSAPCADGLRERTSAFDMSSAKLVESPMPARPAEDRSNSPWVAVQAVVGLDGRFHEMRALGGPDVLQRAAVEAVRGWRVEPARANGEALASVVTVRVSFTPSGAGPFVQ